jgi:choline kinase
VWNNAYSLWLARAAFAESALVVNGDTVHPAQVEQRLLAARGEAPVLLAVDDEKVLGEEEMKVILDDAGRLQRINKALDPRAVHGEYIGVTLVEPEAADRLSVALQSVYERDTTLYYEDGYQEYADWGEAVRVTPIGTREWVEVDNHEDLARAREIACRY